jgi:hypothetical protein
MIAAQVCPNCGNEADLDIERGDLHPCPSCGIRFWAERGGGRGQQFETPVPRKGPLWPVWVAGVSLLVLAAELLLAAAMYGGTAYAIARIAGLR